MKLPLNHHMRVNSKFQNKNSILVTSVKSEVIYSLVPSPTSYIRFLKTPEASVSIPVKWIH